MSEACGGVEADDLLERLAGPECRTPEERASGEASLERYWAAEKTGETCGHCGARLDPAHDLWVVPIPVGPYRSGRYDTKHLPVCEACCPDRGSRCKAPPRPCAFCGRLIHRQRRRRRPGRAYCGERCEQAFYRRRRRRPAEERGCPVCGQEFVPRRADAITCSPACRQKAYRRRKGREGPAGRLEGSGP
jgi:hypothetical protein